MVDLLPYQVEMVRSFSPRPELGIHNNGFARDSPLCGYAGCAGRTGGAKARGGGHWEAARALRRAAGGARMLRDGSM